MLARRGGPVALSARALAKRLATSYDCALMRIDWYPGHMVRARQEAAVALRTTDVVIEVLDARAPHASCNPMVEELRRELRRPALKVLNKADVADAVHTKAWLTYYNAQPETLAIAISAGKNPSDARRIPNTCLRLAPDRASPGKPLRMLILGIPNVGKSTLMNTLLKRPVAKVGDEPAVTKMQMVHRLGAHMSLIDTPGMLWPGIAQAAALKLAACHSIGRNAYSGEYVATELGHHVLRHYRQVFTQRYGTAPSTDDENPLAWIAGRRGYVVKGGGPDLNRAAEVFMYEFRNGILGRISLETVDEHAPCR